MHMDELMQQKIWFCWNYETRNGKRTKVPISACGTPTGTNAPYANTWVTYEEAAKAAKDRGYDGVGFKIPEGYLFLDIPDNRDGENDYADFFRDYILPKLHRLLRRSFLAYKTFNKRLLPSCAFFLHPLRYMPVYVKSESGCCMTQNKIISRRPH
ncbi:MAG: hypothetical protein IJV40_01075 [Oscillospiraceae bacterium]|nr:hypothetical protein [Oscillospiraceae bacterium]